MEEVKKEVEQEKILTQLDEASLNDAAGGFFGPGAYYECPKCGKTIALSNAASHERKCKG